MQQTQSNPAKRIPKSIGTDAKLFGRYTLTDLIVALLPGVVVILLVQVVVPPEVQLLGLSIQTLGLPVAVFAITLGAGFVSLTPTYTSSLDWLASFVGFHAGSTEHDHHEAADLTLVERLHPERDAIERTDGALVGFVSVDPASMALATDPEWTATAEAFGDFLNTTVEFPIQLFSTTRRFPVETHLDHYEQRLSDPDVRANSRLETLIEQYLAWYGDELKRRRMTIRDHYVVVSVSPEEVRFEADSLAGRLASLPVLGGLASAWREPPASIAREAMFDELDARCRRIETGIRDIDGCSARRIDLEAALSLVRRFWTGQDDVIAANTIRSHSLIGGSRD